MLYMDVYIANGDSYDNRAFAEMFVRAECNRASSPAEADVVVFTGGADVNPALYGEDAHSSTIFSDVRDHADLEVYKECYENGIPMFGVCRGAQFLHVMQGGRLVQDLDGHNGNHPMWDTKRRQQLPRVSSVHHQACIKDESLGMEIIGISGRSRTRWLNPVTKQEGAKSDVEAYFYRDVCAFGVQGHPEYRDYTDFRIWCLEYLNELIDENPDIELVKEAGKGSVRRIKQDILDARTHGWADKLAAKNTIILN